MKEKGHTTIEGRDRHSAGHDNLIPLLILSKNSQFWNKPTKLATFWDFITLFAALCNEGERSFSRPCQFHADNISSQQKEEKKHPPPFSFFLLCRKTIFWPLCYLWFSVEQFPTLILLLYLLHIVLFISSYKTD